MKNIFIITTLLLVSIVTKAQTVTAVATKFSIQNSIQQIVLNKEEVVDLTTTAGERIQVEDIEDGWYTIPNVQVTKDHLVVTTINGKLPLQQIFMESRMIHGPETPIGGDGEGSGGDMGGGGK